MKDPISEAIGRCNPDEPLKPGDPRWFNFDAIRGIELHKRVIRRLNGAVDSDRYSHIALAGHRGCGKSTELNRICLNVEREGYLPLYAMVNEQSDPNDVGFSDLVLLMLRLLEQAFGDPARKLKPLPKKTIALVEEWFLEIIKREEKELERSLAYEGKAGLGVDSPLARLFFDMTAMRKMTGKKNQEIKEVVERYPDELGDNMNLLLDDAIRISHSAYPKGILFILDNLDRYPPDMISNCVLRQADLFKSIQAHTIFVVPISLLYEPIGETVEDRYEPETLPMIPIFNRNAPRQVEKDALASITQAIYQRISPQLFEDPALASEIGRLSGGCPRDVMHLLQEALLETEKVIRPHAVQRAASMVRGEMARKLTLKHYDILARAHIETAIDSDEEGRFLLYRRAALEYNGERWIGVHPLLWDTKEFRRALHNQESGNLGNG